MKFSVTRSFSFAFTIIAVFVLYQHFKTHRPVTIPTLIAEMDLKYGNRYIPRIEVGFTIQQNVTTYKKQATGISKHDYFYIPMVKVFNFTTQKEFLEEMERRRQHVYKICATKGYTKFRTFSQDLTANGFGVLLNESSFIGGLIKVDERHNYTLTVVPKGAATTLTQVVTFTRNPEPLKTLSGVPTGFGNRIKQFNNKQIVSILLNFKKAVVVRDPLRRLVSAWNDKFKRTQNNFVNLGRKILHHIRPDADVSQVKTGYPFHFNDFLSWMDNKNGFYQNFHWIQISNLTNICGIPYDYIIRFENLEQELNAFIKLVTGTELPDFPSSNAKMSNKKDYEPTFEAVVNRAPKDMLMRVLQTYNDDFDIFEYQMPSLL